MVLNMTVFYLCLNMYFATTVEFSLRRCLHMSNSVREFPAMNGTVLSKFRLFLSTSICDGYTRYRICKNLERSQVDLCVILTAKILFDRVKNCSRIYICGIERKTSLSDIERFLCDRRRKEAEKIVKNEHLVFVGCTIVASKMYMDFSYANFSWVEICYYTVDQINTVERYVLQVLDYNIILDLADLKKIHEEFSHIKEGVLTENKGEISRWDLFKRTFYSLFHLASCKKT